MPATLPEALRRIIWGLSLPTAGMVDLRGGGATADDERRIVSFGCTSLRGMARFDQGWPHVRRESGACEPVEEDEPLHVAETSLGPDVSSPWRSR
jgi:hypothetical protein